jgi:hypothetical protein
MTVLVAAAHAHVQRPFSVVKMETVLEEYTTEEQRSVMRFYGQKDPVQRIFIKTFSVSGGKCLSRKAVHSWLANVSLMTKRLKRRCGSG